MSTSPTPESAGNNSSDAGEWRSNVQQSYRNTEVREIAKVLATLEPGSTSASKIKLAMKFEDSVFTTAKSLEDYRKKIKKRLQKLQKNYKAPSPTNATVATGSAAAATGSSSTVPTGGAATAGATTPASATTTGVPAATTTGGSNSSIDPRIIEMRRKHGSALKFIVKNAKAAYKLMKDKYGVERANQLYQHTQNAKQWSIELGIIDGKTFEEINSVDKQNDNTSIKNNDEAIKRMMPILDQRVDNIRSHVVKLTHPDMFLLETLEKIEPEFINNTNISKVLASIIQRRFKSVGWDDLHNDTLNVLLKSFDLCQQKITPIPKSKPNAAKLEALEHIERMRAASQALISYIGLKEKKDVAPRNVLSKCHNVISTGTNAICDVLDILDKEEEMMMLSSRRRKGNNNNNNINYKKHIKLEDAWNKIIVLPVVESNVDNANTTTMTTTTTTTTTTSTTNDPNDTNTDSTTNSPDKQQQQQQHHQQQKQTMIRSCVLLKPGRKLQQSFKNELKNKRAILVQRGGGGSGSISSGGTVSHIVLEFGSVFIMKIYLVPLVVHIEEMNPIRSKQIIKKEKRKEKEQQEIKRKEKESGDDNNNNSTINDRKDEEDEEEYNRSCDFYNNGEEDEDVDMETDGDDDDDDDEENGNNNDVVVVWGVRGSRYLLNNVIQNNLQNASHKATLVLRQIFTRNDKTSSGNNNTQTKQQPRISDFEIEISEASSLLSFLQLARTTYDV